MPVDYAQALAGKRGSEFVDDDLQPPDNVGDLVAGAYVSR